MNSAAGPTLDAHVVDDDAYAILMLSGTITPGCYPVLAEALLTSENHDHGHVIVDVRHVHGMTPKAVEILLWELARAFDDGRTLRLVVRDAAQKATLDGLGLTGMLPTHETLAGAMSAVDAVQSAQHSTAAVIELELHPAPSPAAGG